MFKKNSLFLSFLFLANQIFASNYIKSENLIPNNNRNPISSNYLRNYPRNQYILGPGDILGLKAAKGAKEINSIFSIDSEGMANLKRLKRVYVSGLTINELSELLNKEYAKFLNVPNVTLNIINFRPVKYYLEGEVVEQGLHILPGALSVEDKIRQKNNLNNLDNLNIEQYNEDNIPFYNVQNYFFPTLIDAIREGGGITINSDLKDIKVIRQNSITNGGGKISTSLNLLSNESFIDSSQNIRIFDGDTIIIKKSARPIISEIAKAYKSNINPNNIKVTIIGRVESPGVFTLGRGASVSEAILTSGGLKPFKGKTTLVRYKSDGTIDRTKFKFVQSSIKGSKNNPYLRNGDFIFVGKGNFKNISDILSEVSDPISSLISSYTFFKLLND